MSQPIRQRDKKLLDHHHFLWQPSTPQELCWIWQVWFHDSWLKVNDWLILLFAITFSEEIAWKSLCINFFWSLNCLPSKPTEVFRAGSIVALRKSYASCIWQAWSMTPCFRVDVHLTHARESMTPLVTYPNKSRNFYKASLYRNNYFVDKWKAPQSFYSADWIRLITQRYCCMMQWHWWLNPLILNPRNFDYWRIGP